jgi:hypothetical protein
MDPRRKVLTTYFDALAEMCRDAARAWAESEDPSAALAISGNVKSHCEWLASSLGEMVIAVTASELAETGGIVSQEHLSDMSEMAGLRAQTVLKPFVRACLEIAEMNDIDLPEEYRDLL